MQCVNITLCQERPQVMQQRRDAVHEVGVAFLALLDVGRWKNIWSYIWYSDQLGRTEHNILGYIW